MTFKRNGTILPTAKYQSFFTVPLAPHATSLQDMEQSKGDPSVLGLSTPSPMQGGENKKTRSASVSLSMWDLLLIFEESLALLLRENYQEVATLSRRK